MAPYTAVVLLQLRQMDLASYWKRRGLVSCPRNKHIFRCDQNGPPARRKGGRISRAIRNRRATQPPAHFHRNPLGRGEGHAYLGDRTLGPPPLVEAHKLFFKLGAWRGCLLLMALQFLL